MASLPGFLLSIKEARRKNLNVDIYVKISLFILIGAVFGAGLFWVLENLGYYLKNLSKRNYSDKIK